MCNLMKCLHFLALTFSGSEPLPCILSVVSSLSSGAS